ncbi:MAG: hypothetical protein ABIN96_05915 [Rubrivivax sp.]
MTLQSPEPGMRPSADGLSLGACASPSTGLPALWAKLHRQQTELDALRATCAQQSMDAVSYHEQLSRFAHDLRTPLAAVLAWASVLAQKEGSTPAAELADGVAAIGRNARQQAAVIDGFMRDAADRIRLPAVPLPLLPCPQAPL